MILIVNFEKLAIILIYLFYKTQFTLLTSIKIVFKYSNFFNIIFSHFTIDLPKHIKINNYLIN